MTVEQRTIAGIQAALEEATRMADAARAAVERARGDVEKAEATLGAAKTTHDNDPSAKNADAEQRAELALRRAQRLLEDANAKASTADHAVATAEQSLAAARLDARKADLRRRASPETLATAIGPHWAAILSGSSGAGAFGAMRGACNAIVAADTDNVRASGELRSLGEYVADLDPLHAILPALRHLADQGHAVSDLNEVRVHRQLQGNALPDLMGPVTALLGRLDRPASPPDHVAGFKERLRRVAATRTSHEREALELAELDAAQRARNESPEGQKQAAELAAARDRMRRPPSPRGWSQ
jgi:hypothetical protein